MRLQEGGLLTFYRQTLLVGIHYTSIICFSNLDVWTNVTKHLWSMHARLTMCRIIVYCFEPLSLGCVHPMHPFDHWGVQKHSMMKRRLTEQRQEDGCINIGSYVVHGVMNECVFDLVTDSVSKQEMCSRPGPRPGSPVQKEGRIWACSTWLVTSQLFTMGCR